MDKIWYLRVVFLVVAGCMIFSPAIAAQVDSDRMNDLGQRAALTAMEELNFEYGDPDILVVTDAGRVLVDGQTTEKAISGITKVSGLQNGDGNLYQINRAEWKPLWFYFYDKESGKGLYLEPDESYYELNQAELADLSAKDAFLDAEPVTVDLDQMLADTDDGNKTMSALGQNNALMAISNYWAYGAPYDLMTVAMLHDHFCPGVTAGYMIVKYAEEEMPITDGTSYTVISCPIWCKDDAFPILWDITPGKKGPVLIPLSDSDEEVLLEKYNTSPAGIIIRWNSREKTGQGIAVGFNWDDCMGPFQPWTQPSWGYYPKITENMLNYLDEPEEYVSTIYDFDVNETTLAELKDPANNPYEILGML